MNATIVQHPGAPTVSFVNREIPYTALKLHPFVQDFRHQENPKQRDARIQELVSTWDESLVGRLLVVPAPDGAFYILEGGHRRAAAQILHESGRRDGLSVPCSVVHGIDWDDKPGIVHLLLGLQDQRGWTAYNKYALRRDSGMSPQSEIERILNAHSSRTVPPGHGNGYVCVQKLEQLYSYGVLDEVAQIIEEAWPNSDGRHAMMVQALGTFARAYKGNTNYNTDQFIEKLSLRSPRELLVQARAGSKAKRTSMLRILCADLVDIYNSKRRNQLPDFRMPRR